jgi:hypothetical protein
VVWPPYQLVARLYAAAIHNWPAVEGSHPNVDLLRLPMHKFLSVIWIWCLERVKPEDQEEWRMMMEAPFPGEAGQARPAPFSEEEEADSFMALMAAQKQGG